MRLIHLLLTIALIVPMGCGLTLDDPKVATLEKQLAEVNEKLDSLSTKVEALTNALAVSVKANLDLAAENESLKGHVDSLQTVIAQMENRVEPTPDLVVKFKHNKVYNIPATNTLAEKVLAVYKPGKVKIVVNGYSSLAGPAKLNRWFSKERAEGVAHKLFQLGVTESDVKIIAHGETDDNERKVVVTVEVL